MNDARITRRQFVIGAGALAGIAVLAGCSSTNQPVSDNSASPTQTNPPGGSATTSPPLPAGPTSSLSPTPTTQPASTLPATTTTLAEHHGAPATFVDHGKPDTDMVALTFHLSGAPGTVSALLDLLDQRSVKVTAFAVGTWITANPDITKRLVAAGHELGNHTEHHLAMDTLTRQQISDEIVECGQALVPFIGTIGKWFRPSATVVPQQMILDEAGLAGYPVSVGYDVDSVDNKDPGSAAIISNVNTNIHPGAIVSLHFGHRGTVEALPHILDHLASVNLRPVTVSTLLA